MKIHLEIIARFLKRSCNSHLLWPFWRSECSSLSASLISLSLSEHDVSVLLLLPTNMDFGRRSGASIEVPSNSPGGSICARYIWACLPFNQTGFAESKYWWANLSIRSLFWSVCLARCCHRNKNRCRSQTLLPNFSATVNGVSPLLSAASISAPINDKVFIRKAG